MTGNIFFSRISPLGKIFQWVDRSSYRNVTYTGLGACICLIAHGPGFIFILRLTFVCIYLLILLHMYDICQLPRHTAETLPLISVVLGVK